jgi:hypothetical protein
MWCAGRPKRTLKQTDTSELKTKSVGTETQRKIQKEQYQQKQNRKKPQKNQTMRSDVTALSD